MPPVVPQSPSTTPQPYAQPVTLASVKAQLTSWRATRVKGTRTPNTIWEGIKTLSSLYDCHTLASALALDPRKLCTKMEEWGISPQSLPVTKGASFVEVPFVPSAAAAVHPSVEQRGTSFSTCVELARPDGTTLKVQGLVHQEIVALAERFLGH